MEKMQRRGTRHTVDVLFVLMLFCVLAICALSVVLIGAGVYRDAVARMDDNFYTGSSLSYISNKIRQNDVGGTVYVAQVEGTPALVMERVFNEQPYCTYIFHHDGYLREVMTRKDNAVALTDGQAILETGYFGIAQREEGLLEFTARGKGGEETSVLLSLRSQSTDE